jgi:NAD(P)H-quinone oxidoreductase subunit I
MSVYDRHELNLDNVALGRLPYKVNDGPHGDTLTGISLLTQRGYRPPWVAPR